MRNSADIKITVDFDGIFEKMPMGIAGTEVVPLSDFIFLPLWMIGFTIIDTVYIQTKLMRKHNIPADGTASKLIFKQEQLELEMLQAELDFLRRNNAL